MTSLEIPTAPNDRRVIAAQVVRYALAGLAITLLFSASYWAVTELFGIKPMISLTIVFLVFTAISYVTHGRFSFRGHGGRDRTHVRATRFLIVNLIGFALNQWFVWLLVVQLHGPTWWPIVPFIAVTPWVTFALHRRWVFS
ncbi:MAG: GtrA family protein [Sphingomicrobium sp.]